MTALLIVAIAMLLSLATSILAGSRLSHMRESTLRESTTRITRGTPDRSHA